MIDFDTKCKSLIAGGEHTFVLTKDGEILRALSGIGVRPLLVTYTEEPQIMEGCFVYDKVIGKAAATIAVLGKVKSVWGQIMSEPGKAFLEAHGIAAFCETLVPIIENRTGDDMCPLEKSVKDIDDPVEGIAAIRATVAKLMAAKAAAQQN